MLDFQKNHNARIFRLHQNDVNYEQAEGSELVILIKIHFNTSLSRKFFRNYLIVFLFYIRLPHTWRIQSIQEIYTTWEETSVFPSVSCDVCSPSQMVSKETVARIRFFFSLYSYSLFKECSSYQIWIPVLLQFYFVDHVWRLNSYQ